MNGTVQKIRDETELEQFWVFWKFKPSSASKETFRLYKYSRFHFHGREYFKIEMDSWKATNHSEFVNESQWKLFCGVSGMETWRLKKRYEEQFDMRWLPSKFVKIDVNELKKYFTRFA